MADTYIPNNRVEVTQNGQRFRPCDTHVFEDVEMPRHVTEMYAMNVA